MPPVGKDAHGVAVPIVGWSRSPVSRQEAAGGP
jgi:hypothetical protein